MKVNISIVGFTAIASVLAAQAWGQPTTPPPAAPAPAPAPAPLPAPAPPAAPAPAPAPAPVDVGSAGSGKNQAATENVQAQGSLPQVTAARGGSFGIASTAQTAGLHASVDAKLFGDGSNASAFAQLAGLPVTGQLSVDVVGQSVTQDLQRFEISNSTAKPELVTSTLSSAGVRLKYQLSPFLVVSKLQTPECMSALQDTVAGKRDDGVSEQVAMVRLLGDGGLGLDYGHSDGTSLDQQVDRPAKARAAEAAKQAALIKASQSTEGASKVKIDALSADLDKAKAAVTTADDNATTAKEGWDRNGTHFTFNDTADLTKKVDAVRSACKLGEISGFSGWTVTGGIHALRRSSVSDNGVASVGGALEGIIQHDRLNTTFFAGLSFEYLNSALDKDTGAQFDYVAFHALRLSFGYEYRASHTSGGNDLLPRVGFYGVASLGWWKDPYTFKSVGGTIDNHITSTELEGGFYASGKFTTNFTGMIALRVLKPFGDYNQGSMFLISLIPAVSAGK